MSRPKPTVLLEKLNNKTYQSEQVLFADAIWAVFYENNPFNLKTCNYITNYPSPKYKKTSFSNPGHAHNLAARLNKDHNTNKFIVVKLTAGEVEKDD